MIQIEALLQHSSWLRRLAQDLVGHPDRAEDLVQETFLKVLQNPPRDAANPRGWLRIVLVRIAANWRREAAARGWHERNASRAESWSPADVENSAVLQRRLAEAVHELEEPYRTAITLHYYEKLTAEEIVRVQGISYENVRKRLERGRDKLRARLDREYGDRRAWSSIVVLLHRKGTPGPISGSEILKLAAVAAAVAALPILALLTWNALRPAEPIAPAPQTAAAEIPLPPPAEGTAEAERSFRESLRAPVRPEDRATGLHGVVLDPLGTPVQGARVAAVADDQRGYVWDPEAPVVRRKVGEAVTDELGTFVIPVTRDSPYDLEVSAEGFATTFLGYRYAGEAVTVRLDLGAVLRGRAVRASDGSPVAGARLEVTTFQGSLEAGRALTVSLGSTDADGRFQFMGLPAVRVALKVRPVSDGPPRVRVVTLAAGRSEEVAIEIEDGVSVRGRVLDADTLEPITDAEVGEVLHLHEFERVDEDGIYACSGIRTSGAVAMQARARGYAAETRVFRAEAGVDDLPEHFDFRLSRGCLVRGRLLDAGGEPVVDGRVEVVSNAPIHPDFARAARIRGRTDARGRFELPDASRELALTLLARNEGSGALVRPCPAVGPGANVLELSDVFLPPASIVRGTVVGEDGSPVPNLPVVLQAQGGPSLMRQITQRWARTDDQGRFAIADLAGGEFRIEVRPPDAHSPVGSDVSVPAGSCVDDLRLVLPRLGSIAGRVTDADGEPLQGVRVVPIRGDGDHTELGALTDATGSFRIHRLVQGSHRLRILAGLFGGRLFLGQETADVYAGTEELHVVLEAAVPQDGQVFDAEGRPVRNAAVFARVPGRDDVFLGLTNPDGTFSIPVPQGVSVDLEVYLPREQCPLPPLSLGAAPASEPAARLRSVLPTDPDVILRLPR